MLTGGVDEVFSRMESADTHSALTDGLGSTLAGLPAAAEYRVIEGINEAVLVNTSAKGIEIVKAMPSL